MVTAAPPPPVVNVSPVVSPDGRRIAYWHHVAAHRNTLIVIRSDGRGKHALATARGTEAAWSPDGTMLAYVSHGIHVVATAGGKPRLLTRDQRMLDRLEWTDAQTIAFVVNDCCYLGGVPFTFTGTVTLGATRTDNWGETECEYNDDCPTVSPDGRHRFLIIRERGRNGPWRVQLRGDDMQPLDLGETPRFQFSRTGKFALWGGAAASVVADANGQHPTTLDTEQFVEWSPDDAYLAYVDGTTLFDANGDGTGVRAVTSGVTSAVSVGSLWSSHGTWLVIPRTDAKKRVTSTVVRPDGTGQHPLVHWRIPITKSNYGFDVTWSSLSWAPDDTWAAYYDRCGRGYAIYRVDATSGVQRRLTPCR